MPKPAATYLSDEGSYLAELWRRREFMLALASANMEIKNVSAVLGMAWWVLNPLLLGAVYFLVIGIIFGAIESNPNYLSYLLSGLFAFQYTNTSLVGAVSSVLTNAELLVTVRFPRLVLPLAAIVEAGLGFGASLVGFAVIIGPIEGLYIGRNLLVLPVVFLVHTLFNLGIAGILARFAIPFRDVNNLVVHFIRLWIYLSPILWTPDLIENSRAWVVALAKVNPLFPILSLYRSALTGTPIEWAMLAIAAAWAITFCSVGITLFVRFESRLPRHLL